MAEQQNELLYQVAQHMKESLEETKEELRNSVNDLKKDLKENTEITRTTLVQATKTNGRANALEQFAEDTKKAIEALVESNKIQGSKIALIEVKHDSDVRSVKWIFGIVGFFVAGFVTIGYALIEKNIEDSNSKQQAQMEQQLETDTAQKVVDTLQGEYNIKVN